jgi:hypothetical protein
MNTRLLKVAKYLGKQGLYEEAASLKVLAMEDISPPEWQEAVDAFFESLDEDDKKDLHGDNEKVWRSVFKSFLMENYKELEDNMEMIFDLVKDDSRCTCAADEDEDEGDGDVIPNDIYLFPPGTIPGGLIRR